MAKLHTREIIDYERSCRPVWSARLTDPDELNVGDHLRWRHVGVWRDAIILESSKHGSIAKLKVIRYGHTFGFGMVVRQETWNIDMSRDAVYVYDYGQHCHMPSIVVMRAKACVGQGNYNALRNSNDDFCRWCKSGQHTYLCVNEVFLCVDADDTTRGKDGVHCLTITSLDQVYEGDHISWLQLYHSTDVESDWRHGVVCDVDMKTADVVTFSDKTGAVDVISFSALNFVDHKVHRYVYEQCHMVDNVLLRAMNGVGRKLLPEQTELFARWCKLGIPTDADSVQKRVVLPANAPVQDTENEDVKIGKEAGVVGARTAATGIARTVEGVTAKVALGSAARQTPRVLVRGAAEGAAAAAAVGVEAIVLAVDVGLTYRSFSRKEITKDELHSQNIQSTVRSASSAASSVGGGVAGAAIGSLIFPGIGTIVGGVVGGIIGGISGQIGGHFAGKGIAYLSSRPYENLFVEDGIEIVDS